MPAMLATQERHREATCSECGSTGSINTIAERVADRVRFAGRCDVCGAATTLVASREEAILLLTDPSDE